MEVSTPHGATAEPIIEILDAATKISDGNVEKALLYAPDAIGEALFRDFPGDFKPVLDIAPLQVPVRSMSPSYTPVCYGSMFTGLSPEGHGITKYDKPVLKCDTLFDALSRAGKKVALVAVEGSSIDTIFRALQLLEEGVHDLILVYNQEYDDTMHGSTPRSPEALEAFRRHLASFVRLGEVFNEAWASSDRVIAFLPDHGTHVDPESGKGSHGTDSPEDMEVHHFWGVYRGS
jgi:hypothetical protein